MELPTANSLKQGISSRETLTDSRSHQSGHCYLRITTAAPRPREPTPAAFPFPLLELSGRSPLCHSISELAWDYN